MSNSGQLQVFGSLTYTVPPEVPLITITHQQKINCEHLMDPPACPDWECSDGTSPTHTPTSWKFCASNGSGDRLIFDHDYITMSTLSNAQLIPNGGGGGSCNTASDGQEGRAISKSLGVTYTGSENPYSKYSPEWYLWEKQNPWLDLYYKDQVPWTFLTNINTLAAAVQFADLPVDALWQMTPGMLAWGMQANPMIGAITDTWN